MRFLADRVVTEWHSSSHLDPPRAADPFSSKDNPADSTKTQAINELLLLVCALYAVSSQN